MEDLVKAVEATQMKKDMPHIEVGDRVRVHLRIREGQRERIQVFEGYVIARKGKGVSETITVRRVSYGVGVERVFLLHSPLVEKIERVHPGVVRRAKLYYLRERTGRASRIRERLVQKRIDEGQEIDMAEIEAEAQAVEAAEEAESEEE